MFCNVIMNSLRIVNLSLRPFILSDCVSGVLWHESVPCWTMRPVSDTDVSSQFHKITFSSVLGQLWNTNASLSVQLICLPNTSYLFFFRQKILVTCSQWITNYPPLGEKCKERSFQIAHLWFRSFQGFSLESWIRLEENQSCWCSLSEEMHSVCLL